MQRCQLGTGRYNRGSIQVYADKAVRINLGTAAQVPFKEPVLYLHTYNIGKTQNAQDPRLEG